MIPINLSATAIAMLVGLTSGAFFMGRYKTAQFDAQISAAQAKAAETEAALVTQMTEVSHDYENQIDRLNGVIANTTDELGRLRVKRCPAVPKTAAAIQPADAAAAGQPDGDREIEIDLDGTAAEIIRLGGDLDRARAQITGLQQVVKKYLSMNKEER